jgi:hypothetical protein
MASAAVEPGVGSGRYALGAMQMEGSRQGDPVEPGPAGTGRRGFDLSCRTIPPVNMLGLLG